MMKICYCTRLLPYEDNFFEKYKKYGFVVSSHKYILNQLDGLISNGFYDIEVINVPDVFSYPKFPKAFFRRVIRRDVCNIRAYDIGFINIPILKQITQNINLYKNINKWVKNNNDEKAVIMSYSINPTFIKPLIKIRDNNPNIKLCLVVGDLWGAEGVDQHNKGIKKFLVDKYMESGMLLAKKSDMFIFVAGAMAKALEVTEKPFLVIEGINNYRIADSNNFKEDLKEKTIFYAGNLDAQFGAIHLLNAFEQIPYKNYKLILAGGGDSDEVIRDFARKDPRIIFLGYVSPDIVKDTQLRATVLVNPRQNIATYTQYSFPSKTMECLASGKPYIAYKLPGIPNEYDDYIQYVQGESEKELAEKIIQICEMPQNERLLMGLKGQSFILTSKNAKAFGAKTLDFLEKNL